jgi:hypothetical protein
MHMNIYSYIHICVNLGSTYITYVVWHCTYKIFYLALHKKLKCAKKPKSEYFFLQMLRALQTYLKNIRLPIYIRR